MNRHRNHDLLDGIIVPGWQRERATGVHCERVQIDSMRGQMIVQLRFLVRQHVAKDALVDKQGAHRLAVVPDAGLDHAGQDPEGVLLVQDGEQGPAQVVHALTVPDRLAVPQAVRRQDSFELRHAVLGLEQVGMGQRASNVLPDLDLGRRPVLLGDLHQQVVVPGVVPLPHLIAPRQNAPDLPRMA